MINFTIFLINLFPIVCFGYFVVENLFLYLVILILVVAFGVLYFIADKYKKNFAFKRDALIMKINLLKKNNETISKELEDYTKEIADLQLKLKDIENERNSWIEEKKKLEEEIKDLKIKTQDFNKKDDIVIEYYMNKKSGD